MKQLLVAFLFISNLSFGQQFGIKISKTTMAAVVSYPVKTATRGNLMVILAKEEDRNIGYFQYVENLKITKSLSLYGGTGIHMGTRSTLNYKKTSNVIFLAGATVVGGIKLDIMKIAYISADITPRVDFPFLGGCHMHKHCGEAKLGEINLSIGLNLK